MAYDEKLAARIREALASRGSVTEKKMFGGLAFMLRGHMACGVVGEDLMARIGRDAYERALGEPHVRPMDFTGKPLSGMVYVGPGATRNARALRRWVDRAADFAASLPAKTAKTGATKKRTAKKQAVARKRTARG